MVDSLTCRHHYSLVSVPTCKEQRATCSLPLPLAKMMEKRGRGVLRGEGCKGDCGKQSDGGDEALSGMRRPVGDYIRS